MIEGLLKADISHCLTGRTFAAIAGANNTSPLDPLFALLAQNGTEEIIEAHDMDKYNNQMTMAGASSTLFGLAQCSCLTRNSAPCETISREICSMTMASLSVKLTTKPVKFFLVSLSILESQILFCHLYR